jgi:hypothetical protein
MPSTIGLIRRGGTLAGRSEPAALHLIREGAAATGLHRFG